MARMDLRAGLHDQVTRSIADGARLAPGGAPLDDPGSHDARTLLGDVTRAHTPFLEALFGPVGAVIRRGDADQAAALANDTEFGLGAALWTAHMDVVRRMIRQIDAEAVFVNGMVASDALGPSHEVGLWPQAWLPLHPRPHQQLDIPDRRRGMMQIGKDQPAAVIMRPDA